MHRLSLKRLMVFLEGEGYTVILEEQPANALVGHSAQSFSKGKLGERCDFVIVAGATRTLVKYSVPLLGINRGRLGFLTDITQDDIDQKVAEVLAGKYMDESQLYSICQ